MTRIPLICLLALLMALPAALRAQPVTGVWKGRIDRKKVEVKIIQNGDSLTGTSYYFESENRYRRYRIKGYFDPRDNSVVWWDDVLLEEKGNLLFGKSTPLRSVADFNCPGGNRMYLDGKASLREDPENERGTVGLTKASGPSFPDEWDYVIDNYTIGANDPDVIDSIEQVAAAPRTHAAPAPRPAPPVASRRPGMVSIPPMPAEMPKAVATAPAKPQTIEEKYTARQKVVALDIPVKGDSILLSFYDNAEVDGDSISLFLNHRLLFTHVRLTDKPYTIRIAAADLQSENELAMVAENLGSIPPNTSYMVAMVDGTRYAAQLASTENSSAVIVLRKGD
ncbi:MAG: hypothetical protein JWP27_1987 [Flaviaesturariibacter sp.]|nr:hypothetical protein [Flaviaesturariibacter sp.]